jgi:uncharacterized surface anchored protein
VHNITVTDDFPAYLDTSDIEDTTTVEEVGVDLYGNLTGTATPLTEGTSDGEYSISPDGTVVIHGETSGAYRVTYTTPIDTTQISQTGGTYSFTNKASITSDEITEPMSATSTVGANFGKKLEKLATGTGEETIPGQSPSHRPVYNFAIRYNYNQGSIDEDDNYVDDVYDPDAAYDTSTQGGSMGFDPSSVVVYSVYYDDAGNAQRGPAIDPSEYTVTQSDGAFRVQFDSDNTGQAYLITYSTYATGNTDNTSTSQEIEDNYTVRNTATTGGNNPPTSSVTTTVRQQGIVKKFVSADVANKVIHWQVDINPMRYEMDNLE